MNKSDKTALIIIILTFLLVTLYFAHEYTLTYDAMQHKYEMEKLEIEKEIALIQQNQNIKEEYKSPCEFYASQNEPIMQTRGGQTYYFIDNKWIEEIYLWESCLAK